jgi:hypothetical protein
MPVTIIHFFRHATDWLSGSPDSFQSLAMGPTRTLMVCHIIAKLAILDMSMDMQRWNKFLKFLQLVNEIRKVLGKSLVKFDTMLASDVVVEQNIYQLRMLSKGHH